MAEPTTDKSTPAEDEGGTGQKVIVGGNEFDSYQDAAESLDRSHRELQGSRDKDKTVWEDERATLQTEKAELKAEKERLETEQLEREKPPETPEIDPDVFEADGDFFRHPQKYIKLLADAGLDEKVAEAIAKTEEKRKIANLSEKEKKQVVENQKLLVEAEAECPELKDEKVANKVEKVLRSGTSIEFMVDQLREYPEVIRQARNNFIVIGYYYSLKLDGTLEKKLNEALKQGEGKPTLLGGSGGIAPKSGLTDKEWDALTDEERTARKRANMLKNAVRR